MEDLGARLGPRPQKVILDVANVVLGRKHGQAQVAEPEQLPQRHLIMLEAGVVEMPLPTLKELDHTRCLAVEQHTCVLLRKRLWKPDAPRAQPTGVIPAVGVGKCQVESLQQAEHLTNIGIHQCIGIKVKVRSKGVRGM